ncbi:uncharacterized protein HaLaN_15480 [Haematococcus lacustris]|uniref:Uncharacterized protein n=1 Tax=Haematococcus lacustris TaxID=44745 RepID=A0A699Z8Y5_HAELA|nr:uncharacterized protein HaLaN_15480 [Haematococcus lacustris]
MEGLGGFPCGHQVALYHGPKRCTDVSSLQQADVVLTTYSVLENEYRKYMMARKVTCQYCSKRFYPDRLKPGQASL